MSAATDLAVEVAPDLAVARDLSIAGIDLAYGTDTDGAATCVPPSMGTVRKFVVNQQHLPGSSSEHAYDLNGDNRRDNQLGSIVAVLRANSLDPQSSVDGEIANGQALLLATLHSNDSALANDACAGLTIGQAVGAPSPDFSGSGTFTINAAVREGRFSGPIVSSVFQSAPPPAEVMIPSEVEVRLPFFLVSVPVHLVGARVTVTYSSGNLVQGVLNGAIRKTEIDGVVIPETAKQLDLLLPLSSTIAAIFDTGGTAHPACGSACRNPNGSCAAAGDRHVDVCEVGTNQIVRNLLAPDVQMFDAAGNYRPNPANTQKDSLSVGIGISAVPANF